MGLLRPVLRRNRRLSVVHVGSFQPQPWVMALAVIPFPDALSRVRIRHAIFSTPDIGFTCTGILRFVLAISVGRVHALSRAVSPDSTVRPSHCPSLVSGVLGAKKSAPSSAGPQAKPGALRSGLFSLGPARRWSSPPPLRKRTFFPLSTSLGRYTTPLSESVATQRFLSYRAGQNRDRPPATVLTGIPHFHPKTASKVVVALHSHWGPRSTLSRWPAQHACPPLAPRHKDASDAATALLHEPLK